MFLRTVYPVDPSAPALYDAAAEEWWCYRDLDARIDAMASRLRGARKRLAFCFCRNNFASVTSYLGAIEAGNAVALLDAGMPAEFQSRLLHLYRPEIVMSCEGYLDYRELAAAGTIDRCEAGLVAGSKVWLGSHVHSGTLHPDLSVLLSTSGSTGSPKFVRLSRRNVESNAESICQALQITAEQRAVGSLPLHYSYGLSVIDTHLMTGASLVLTDQGLMAPAFWDLVRKTQCTTFAGVPYSYQILHRLGLEALRIPSLHTLTQAGGKLHNELISEFGHLMTARGGRFFVMYGQTEATARISVLPSSCLPVKLGSVGLPIPGGQVSIDVDGTPTTEPNRTGELIYDGPNVMMGYAGNRGDLAAGDILMGRLRTGDLASLDEDGFVYIQGRAKRDAKIFGLRLNLDELETMVRVHGPSAVTSKGDSLLVFCEFGDATVFAAVTRELAGKLSLNHRVFRFFRVQQLPTNANGKIDYPSLLTMAAQREGQAG
jgi:acyl-CoA synthetase (AMP-forming)/AMP-acid ligase II